MHFRSSYHDLSGCCYLAHINIFLNEMLTYNCGNGISCGAYRDCRRASNAWEAITSHFSCVDERLELLLHLCSRTLTDLHCKLPVH